MELQFKDHPQHISQLIEAVIRATDPGQAVKRRLQRNGQALTAGSFAYDLDHGNVFLVAVGKAAVPMGIAAAEILGDTLTAGVLVTKKSTRDWQSELAGSFFTDRPSAFSLFQAGHPVPDADSVAAARAVMGLLANARERDLVLFMISGGASAILADPQIPLDEWQQLNTLMLASGCTIYELNRVRRQLDRVKGGGLARQAAPATVCSLILSDVVGNPIELIGSGPTVPGQDTPADALAVLQQYGIRQQIKPDAWSRVLAALDSATTSADIEPQKLHFEIIGDVRQAAQAAVVRAAQLGFLSQILTTRLQGEAREVAHVVSAVARDRPPGRCLILGGETTVTIRGEGRGGRNQEMALAAAVDLEGVSGVVVACFATDGEDGPTDAAGAVATGQTASLAKQLGLSANAALAQNDSYTFFAQLRAHLSGQIEPTTSLSAGSQSWVNHSIQTGPTGTNVNDLVFILTYRDHETPQPKRDLVSRSEINLLPHQIQETT